ncbi:MAG: 3'-5' exonuclease [Bacteroidales bacterium]|nr:3'-5' exonuclease [Bacteroidales bacterium]MBO4565951.1 3'-5' exonuclease [Bacteroidales bacterium]
MDLNLQRPLLFFDIESTGLDIPTNSIIELSFVKVFPGGEERIKTWKIKPWDYEKQCQRPIEPAASEVNGVTDDMLVDCPTFYELSDEIASWLEDSDLAGFNSQKFDLPMLAEEFERVALTGKKLNVDLHAPRMVDVQNIFHAMEPRNLKAAYRFYCGGEDFDNAHTAEADTVATYKVLKAQLDRYPDQLKNDVAHLSSFVGKRYVDFSGHLIYNDAGEPVVNFGKHKGKTAREVFEKDPSYFAWIQQGSFSLDTKHQFEKLEERFKLERLAQKFKRS